MDQAQAIGIALSLSPISVEMSDAFADDPSETPDIHFTLNADRDEAQRIRNRR